MTLLVHPIVTHHPLPLPPNILDFSPQSKIQQTAWKSPGMINYLLRSSQLMKPQKSEKLQYVVIDEIITIQRMLRAPTHSLPLPDSARLPTGIYRGLWCPTGKSLALRGLQCRPWMRSLSWACMLPRLFPFTCFLHGLHSKDTHTPAIPQHRQMEW